jgi:hypothetical protein
MAIGLLALRGVKQTNKTKTNKQTNKTKNNKTTNKL